MKQLLLFSLFVSFSMASYSHDWHQIAEDIYAYQLKHKIFSDRHWNKRYARWFNLAMSQMDLLQICNAQTFDTLYINEYLALEGYYRINVRTSKKDFSYSFSLNRNMQEDKLITLEFERSIFRSSYYSKILERWDLDEMQRWSDLYPKEVFDGGTNHYIRIVLQEDEKYDIQMFVTRGFYNEEEDDEQNLEGLW